MMTHLLEAQLLLAFPKLDDFRIGVPYQQNLEILGEQLANLHERRFLKITMNLSKSLPNGCGLVLMVKFRVWISPKNVGG